MTNREYMIVLLSNKDFIGEDNEKYKKMVRENIDCPYHGEGTMALCMGGYIINNETCFKCKNQWLDSEVDE